MIVKGIMDLFMGLLKTLFGWISLPPMPEIVTSSVDWLMEQIAGAKGLIGFFIDWDFVIVCMPIVIALLNFEHVYGALMFVLKKLPFSIE